MIGLVAFFLVGFFAFSGAITLYRRSREIDSRWPRARRVITILLGLIGAYILILVAAFLLQPLFNN
jgi:threonine/homoserine/homoserine lactone efflux protein